MVPNSINMHIHVLKPDVSDKRERLPALPELPNQPPKRGRSDGTNRNQERPRVSLGITNVYV